MQMKLPNDLAAAVSRALAEDIGSGDVTAQLISIDTAGQATIITREPAILCGTAWVDEVYKQLDGKVEVEWLAGDGDAVKENQLLCALRGPARSLLTGERTALNFLQTLSATATITRAYVEAVAGTHVDILDTRKTVPGLRHAQKYAVLCGGGRNHRHGLYDAILIKENHIMAAGSIAAAIQAARKLNAVIPLEVEVENLQELQEALQAGADSILLDNFTVPQLAEAVALTQGQAKLEASGGISLDSIRAVAETGIDFISVGALTKHIRAIDLSLRFTHPA